jgi:hypothetical protein
MAYDDQDDLFGEDFDFVDEDELEGNEGDDSELEDLAADDLESPATHEQPPKSGQDQQIVSDDNDRDRDNQDRDNQDDSPSRSKRRPRRTKSGPSGERPKPSREETPVGAAVDPEKSDLDEVTDTGDSPEETEAVPEGPPTDHVVHVYELGQFKRTIQREFTAEDAEAFVVEYNRTSRPYSRSAVAASREDEPVPSVS